MSEHLEQETRNETTFRDMNESTAEANDARGGSYRPMESYRCDCSDRR
jgi:hypothetical protein